MNTLQSAFAAFSIALLMLGATASFAKDVGPMHKVSVETEAGPFVWTVELASDSASTSKGLMFRKSLDADKGMLFRFDATRRVAMWMKNTFIPLDMLFIRENGTIARIAADTVPMSEAIIESGEPVRFVLEINAGQAKRLGLKPDQKLSHPWFTQN